MCQYFTGWHSVHTNPEDVHLNEKAPYPETAKRRQAPLRPQPLLPHRLLACSPSHHGLEQLVSHSDG